MRKIKLLSLFSGIGAFETALDRMNIEYELVNFCEIDKYAAKSYCAVHEIDENKYALSEMIQWIWRSAIRNGEDIYIYIPSRRMRDLLLEWLND